MNPMLDHGISAAAQEWQESRLLITISNHKDSMNEIPPRVIQHAVNRHGTGHHYQKHVELSLQSCKYVVPLGTAVGDRSIYPTSVSMVSLLDGEPSSIVDDAS